MAMPERLLIDTSALYAHTLRIPTCFISRASDCLRSVEGHKPGVVGDILCTLVETVALLHRRLGFEVVSEVLGMEPVQSPE